MTYPLLFEERISVHYPYTVVVQNKSTEVELIVLHAQTINAALDMITHVLDNPHIYRWDDHCKYSVFVR